MQTPNTQNYLVGKLIQEQDWFWGLKSWFSQVWNCLHESLQGREVQNLGSPLLPQKSIPWGLWSIWILIYYAQEPVICAGALGYIHVTLLYLSQSHHSFYSAALMSSITSSSSLFSSLHGVLFLFFCNHDCFFLIYSLYAPSESPWWE